MNHDPKAVYEAFLKTRAGQPVDVVIASCPLDRSFCLVVSRTITVGIAAIVTVPIPLGYN